MAKLTLNDVTSSQNQTSLAATLNENFSLIEDALEITLSRDGSIPNSMEEDLDMGSNRVINLPNATLSSEPVTLGQLEGMESNAATASEEAQAARDEVVGFVNGLPFIILSVDTTGTDEASGVIQAAIDALAASGGEIRLPPGDLKVSSTITLGDGTSSSLSTRNNIRIVGAGMGFNGQETTATRDGATRLFWAGSSGGKILSVRGPIASVRLSDFMLDCASLANTGLELIHPFGSRFENINIVRWMGDAIRWTSFPSMAGLYIGSCDNMLENLRVADASSSSNVAAINIGNSSATAGDLGISRNEFHTCTFLAPNNSSCSSLVLQFCDLQSFYNCFFYSAGSGLAATVRVLPPTGLTVFPSGCSFYNCSIHKTPVISGSWTPPDVYSNGQNSGLHFYPFSSDGIGQEPVHPSGGIHGFTQNGTAIYKRQLTTQYGADLADTVVVMHRAMSRVTLTNTITQTNIYSYSLPASSLKTTRKLRLKVSGTYTNNSGSSVGLQIRAFLGATLMLDSGSMTVATSSNPRSFEAIFEVTPTNGSTSTVSCGGKVSLGSAVSASSMSTPTDTTGFNNGVSVDTTIANILAVSAAHGTASSNVTLTIESATLELM